MFLYEINVYATGPKGDTFSLKFENISEEDFLDHLEIIGERYKVDHKVEALFTEHRVFTRWQRKPEEKS